MKPANARGGTRENCANMFCHDRETGFATLGGLVWRDSKKRRGHFEKRDRDEAELAAARDMVICRI